MSESCRQRWCKHKDSRIRDLRRLWKAYCEGDSDELYNYGLCLDYVAPAPQVRGYWRYQLSWGGPSEEFRIYGEVVNDYKVVIEYIEFWFLDWFDGYGRKLVGKDLELMTTLVENWAECGTLAHLRKQALEDL